MHIFKSSKYSLCSFSLDMNIEGYITKVIKICLYRCKCFWKLGVFLFVNTHFHKLFECLGVCVLYDHLLLCFLKVQLDSQEQELGNMQRISHYSIKAWVLRKHWEVLKVGIPRSLQESHDLGSFHQIITNVVWDYWAHLHCRREFFLGRTEVSLNSEK